MKMEVRSVTTIKVFGWTVKVYRLEESVLTKYDQTDIDPLIHQYRISNIGMDELAKQLASLPRVEQLEVTDNSGNGFVIVVYPDNTNI